MNDPVDLARKRLRLTETADSLRCDANRTMWSPFRGDDDALWYCVQRYVKAAHLYRRAGLGLYALDCWQMSARCLDELNEPRKAERHRRFADAFLVDWEE